MAYNTGYSSGHFADTLYGDDDRPKKRGSGNHHSHKVERAECDRWLSKYLGHLEVGHMAAAHTARAHLSHLLDEQYRRVNAEVQK
jgi:hypothetical protein